MHIKIIPISFILLCASTVFAQSLPIDETARLKIGVNAGLVNDGYRTDTSVLVLPHAFYDNNRWYLEGAEGGFYPYKDSKNQVRLGLTYDGRSFDPDDSNTPTLHSIDERDFSVLAHASYMHITPVGGFRIKVGADALARYEGLTASLSHLSRFKFLDSKLTVYPSVGLTWYSDKYNRYYYGISQQEQTNTGIASYNPKSAINPYVSVMAEYVLTDNWSIFGNGRAEKLSKEQKNSPLVDGSVATTARLGVNYSF